MITKVKDEVKGINLYDIIPIQTINKRVNKEKEEKISEFVKIKSSILDLKTQLNSFFNTTEIYEVLKKADEKNRTLTKLYNLRKEFLIKYNYLPTEMENTTELDPSSYSSNVLVDKKDILTKLSNSSVISGSDVKSITDKFGFVTIPYECLNEKSFEKESWDIRSEIKNFVNGLKDTFDIYVITPIEYYSLENHVYQNTKEKQIYSGQHSTVFTSVIINIPMFRSILNTVSDLGDSVDTIKGEISGIKTSLVQIQTTLQNIQRQVDRQQRQLVEQQQKAEEERVKFEAMVLRMIDPVMIAVKKDIDINSDEFDEACCFVGPCWGPDFDERLSMALDLKIIKNQRSKLTKTANELWN